MTLVLRARSNQIYAGLLLVLAGATLVASLLNGGVGELVWATPVAGLFAAFGWAVFWNPRVEIGPAGVQVVNIVREHFVPWADLYLAENRWGLYLYSRAESKKIGAWALPAKVSFMSDSWRYRKKNNAHTHDFADPQEADPRHVRWSGTGRISRFADARFVSELIEIRAGNIRKDRHLRSELRLQAEEAYDGSVPVVAATKFQPVPVVLMAVLLSLAILMFHTT